MNDLFRPEALESKKERALGDVVIINPVSFAFLAFCALLLLLALVAFLVWGEYARKETVSGYLVPDKGMVKLYASHSGQVVERRVEEGDVVQANDVLLVVASQRSSTTIGNIDEALSTQFRQQRELVVAQRNQLARRIELEREALRKEISTLEKELVKLEDELQAQRRRLDLSAQGLAALEALADEGNLSTQRFQAEQRAHLELEALVAGLDRMRLGHMRQIESRQSRLGLSRLELQREMAVYDQELSELDQRLAEVEGRTSFAIRAPVDGTVTGIAAELGQTVNPQIPLLAVLPEGSRLEAHLYVPTRAIGFVKPGQPVQIRYQAFPYQRFGMYPGRIDRVSNAVLAPNEVHAPVAISEPVYAAVVSMDDTSIQAYGQPVPLRPGMLLEASIEVDRHNLLRWVLDPLYALTGKL